MKTFLLIVQILPYIIDLVRKIEEILPETGRGAEKLALLRNLLTAGYAGVSEAWPAIESVVAIVVEFFNRTKGWSAGGGE